MIRVGFVIGGYPPEEHKRRADVALSYSTAEIQVGIVDVAATPYFYGMEERVVGFGVSGFDLPDLTAHREEVIANFVNEAKRLIALGAEVIIPMGISQCPVHISPKWLQEQLGVPVVEGFGAPIRMAALLAGLGLKQSRIRWPKSGAGK